MNMAYAIEGGKAIMNTLMGTSRASSGTSSATSTASTKASNSTSFIDLLLSQITNQNPMEPMDNATMVTQLAQFEMVEKMDNLDENITSMMVYQNMMNSINMIGKNVTITDPDSGQTTTGKVESVQIQNGFPQVVVNGQAYDFGYITNVE